MVIKKRFTEGEVMKRENVQRCRDQHDLVNLTKMLWTLGHTLLEQLRFDEALPIFEEGTQVAMQIQSPIDYIVVEGHVAETLRYKGELRRSVELNEQVLEFARETVSEMNQLLPALLLVKALNDAGEHDRALSLIIHYIELFDRKGIRNPDWYIAIFDALACVLSGHGVATKAARVFGMADACLAATKHRRWLHNDWEYAPYIAKARKALGDTAFEAAHAAGFAMPLEAAIAYTLDKR
jgi:tetratricopeptide (TPR) repeat protein